MLRSRVSLGALIAAYAALLAALSRLRPLWLDEVLQAIGTRDLPTTQVFGYVQTFPGAAPLGYLVQHWSVVALGFSTSSARATSAVFSLLSCVVLIAIARELHVHRRWLAVVCWIVLPLQLRYAVEGRPYSQALFFCVLATFFAVRLLSSPLLSIAGMYGISVVGGIYSAPYVIFLATGYAGGLAAVRRNARTAIYAVFATALAAMSFVPWWIFARPHWTESLADDQNVVFRVSPKFPLLLLKEISGGGYICSVAFLAVVVIGCTSKRLSRPVRTVLLSGIVAGLLLAITADAVFGYFFAIRQVLFILAPLTVLAAEGFSVLLDTRRYLASAIVGLALIGGAVVKDFTYFSDTSENWQAAVLGINQAVSRGACIEFVPPRDALPYEFFDPSLRDHRCSAGESLIAIPVSRYTTAERIRSAREQLFKNGYHPQFAITAGGVNTTVFKRNQR
jgi:hypothetical protein